MSAKVLLWFRRDLRLADNAALSAAIKLNAEILPVFIWAPKEEKNWSPGAASRWWLHQSLGSLAQDLEKLKSKLVLRSGGSLSELEDLVSSTGATHLFWNRLYEPALIERDEKIKSSFLKKGIEAKSFNSSLLFEPWTLQNQSGKPYQVFTPFYNATSKIKIEEPLKRPSALKSPAAWPRSEKISDLGLLPQIRWDKKLEAHWSPGESSAQSRLKSFLAAPVGTYILERDFPSKEGSSKISPHLHFGEIGPRQIWSATKKAMAETKSAAFRKSANWFLREIIWREFAHSILFHFKETTDVPLRKEFEKFPWVKNENSLKKWRAGRTGVPIIDAGMRELYETGWMHNRVRMIVASFLTKHLLISWHEGAKWFWDTLVDADLANNSLGWQWASGCGADAAPYFRIFNPQLQSEKFDQMGSYIRKWVPEIADFSNKEIHVPVRPIIDLKAGRERALEAYFSLNSAKKGSAE